MKTQRARDLHQYASQQAEQVQSFSQEPLHSNAFLKQVVEFLESPYSNRQRIKKAAAFSPPKAPKVFLRHYRIQDQLRPSLDCYSEHTEFLQAFENASKTSGNDILFMCGRPSPEWLNALGSCFDLDLRFFQKHLDLPSPSQRNWFTTDALPSRSQEYVRLVIPSIVFVGAPRRFLSSEDLQRWRNSCTSKVEKHLITLSASGQDTAGHSIIRHINVHRSDCVVVEQHVTVYLMEAEKGWTLFLWSDAGDPHDMKDMVIDKYDKELQDHFDFCPIFFCDRELAPNLVHNRPENPMTHPLSALPTDYGRTLDWSHASHDAFLAVEELLRFHAAASLQCLNMLEATLNETLAEMGRTDIYSVNLENLAIFDNIQTSLMRYTAQYDNVLLLKEMDSRPTPWPEDIAGSGQSRVNRVKGSVQKDIEFLKQKARALIDLCEVGHSRIVANAAAQEARNSNEEAKIVTALGKTTYRLTFIFLPISYVASLFGMNFQQFGQGDLDLWIWAAVTLPLLFICITFVEYGSALKGCLRRMFASRRKHKERYP